MLCSHLKSAPSCQRLPPQARGEHLWRRTSSGAPVDSQGGCLHDRCTCRCRALPHTARHLVFCTPFPEGATGAVCWSDLGDPPGPLSLHPTAPPAAPRPHSRQSGSAARKPSRLQVQSCALSSYKESFGNGYSYCFFLYYPGSKKILHLSWMLTHHHII